MALEVEISLLRYKGPVRSLEIRLALDSRHFELGGPDGDLAACARGVGAYFPSNCKGQRNAAGSLL